MDEQGLPPRPAFLPPGFGTVGHQEFVEIIAPPPVPYEPKTVAWYVLFGAAVLVMAYGAMKWVLRYRRNAYRRLSVRELRALRQRLPTERHLVLQELPRLLKRSALVVFPREQVAPLSGQAWLTFLDQTGPGALSQKSKAALLTLTLGSPEDLPNSVDAELLGSIERWLWTHNA